MTTHWANFLGELCGAALGVFLGICFWAIVFLIFRRRR